MNIILKKGKTSVENRTNTRLSEHSSLCRETSTKISRSWIPLQANDVRVCGCVSSGSARRRWWRSRPGPAGGTSSGGMPRTVKKNGNFEKGSTSHKWLNPHLFKKEKRAFPNLCDFALEVPDGKISSNFYQCRIDSFGLILTLKHGLYCTFTRWQVGLQIFKFEYWVKKHIFILSF